MRSAHTGQSRLNRSEKYGQKPCFIVVSVTTSDFMITSTRNDHLARIFTTVVMTCLFCRSIFIHTTKKVRRYFRAVKFALLCSCWLVLLAHVWPILASVPDRTKANGTLPYLRVVVRGDDLTLAVAENESNELVSKMRERYRCQSAWCVLGSERIASHEIQFWAGHSDGQSGLECEAVEGH